MSLLALALHHFRSYQEASFTFSPKINGIQGPNARGKTNLLEAIYLLATGRSFRTNKLTDLIHTGAPHFSLKAAISQEELPSHLALSFDGEAKKVQHGSSSYSHFTPLLGLLPTLIITPEDSLLIAGAPEGRRRLLDLHLAQIDPFYLYHLSRYHKALKQRNALLKQKNRETLPSWETILLSSAVPIQKRREELVERLSHFTQRRMRTLSSDLDHLEVRFTPSLVTDYAPSREREIVLGSTLAGPHRDDFTFHINGKEAKAFASQGQKRSAVTALRLAEWDHFFEVRKSAPILGIDDFGIHLDEKRTRALLEEVASCGQVFLTAPELATGSVDCLLSL